MNICSYSFHIDDGADDDDEMHIKAVATATYNEFLRI